MTDQPPRPDVSQLRDLLRRIEDRTRGEVRKREPLVLDTVIPGRVVETHKGSLYVIEDDAERFLLPDDDFSAAADLFFTRGQVNREHLDRLDADIMPLVDAGPESMLFLDIETAGFHGMGLFLVGLLTCEGGRFKVTQLLARDYSEEAAVLARLADFYGRAAGVVTFNGRSFDLPFIDDRCVVHRVEARRPALDVDLLHVARRLWKKVLPNCRLGTLEELVCGRRRTGDIPGHLVPAAYRDFVESGDARLMVDVIRHNAYDLVTMAHLLAKISNG